MKNRNQVKNKYLLFLAILLLLPCALADLDNINLNYNYPAKPAQELLLQFAIQNGASNLTNLELKLDVDSPFTLISSESQKLASLSAHATATINYKLYVSGNAGSGKEEITLKYRYDGIAGWKSEDFDIEIAPRTANLEITSVATSPETIKPGERATISLTLKNTADIELRDITIKLDTANLPFAPATISEKTIDEIQEGSSETLGFELITLSTASLQVYKIPVALDYYDSYGQHYTKQNTASLNIFAEPKLDLIVEKNELMLGAEGKLSLKLLNKGIGDAKFVNLKFQSGDYALKSGELYIGEIDSDDYETFELSLTAEKTSITIPVTLEYKDVNNKDYSRNLNLEVKAYTLEQAKQLGIIKGSKAPFFILAAFIAVGLFIVWRLRKKNVHRFS